MLWKLAFTGIKSRIRDYIVLFSGLMMSAAIFYMFETIATNKAFLESNAMISSIVLIFHLGTVLLSLITIVYVFYANSFLLTMRQKDYGMFMMLGAKGRKIGQMIFIETFIIGMLATIVGMFVGVGLATGVNHLMVEQLEIQVTGFSPISSNALAITLVFFVVLFFVTAIVNTTTMMKKPILTLLKAGETPVVAKRNFFVLLIEVIIGLGLLAVGYFMMEQVTVIGFNALIIAFLTIVLGTYFMFHSILVFVIQRLKKIDSFVLKNLNTFVLGQLNFRIQSYTKILSVVAMLVALSLGAITVGLGFRKEIIQITNRFSTYDLVLNNSQAVGQGEIDDLSPTLNVTYSQKEDAENIYYQASQFDENPILVSEMQGGRKLKSQELLNNPSDLSELRDLELPSQRTKNHHLLSDNEFQALELPVNSLQVVKVADFLEKKVELTRLSEVNFTNNPELTDQKDPFANMNQKTVVYSIYNSMFSGLEFMGFFLGIAFLTMLASCLMFKILSGAPGDQVRYLMLTKIGTRKNLLKKSIRQEIGVLFLAPALLGMVHVLFGLKMFNSLLSNPYQGIWLPFLIFFVLYLFYYWLTVFIYTNIVLKETTDNH